MSTDRYRIVRFFRDRNDIHRQTVRGMGGLTEEQAQAHCSNPETSSSTATTAKARARTRKYGAWFDGYEEDR